MWISNAGHADWFFVLAKTSVTESAGRAFTGIAFHFLLFCSSVYCVFLWCFIIVFV
jgi:hypothetical protein